LLEYYQNAIQLQDVLKKAGACIITDRPEPDEKGDVIEYTDLSPEALEKDTILTLLA